MLLNVENHLFCKQIISTTSLIMMSYYQTQTNWLKQVCTRNQNDHCGEQLAQVGNAFISDVVGSSFIPRAYLQVPGHLMIEKG